MSETLTRFNYEVMSHPGGRRSFYDAVLGNRVITDKERVGCLVDYIQYLVGKLVEVGFEEQNATTQAAQVVYGGLHEHQSEHGDQRSHDGIEAIDRYIKDSHGLDERHVFTAHPDPLVAEFYTAMDGMVAIPQGR